MDLETALHIARVALINDRQRCITNWLEDHAENNFWAKRIVEINDAYYLLTTKTLKEI